MWKVVETTARILIELPTFLKGFYPIGTYIYVYVCIYWWFVCVFMCGCVCLYVYKKDTMCDAL